MPVLSLLSSSLVSSIVPRNGHADIAGHAAREIDDLIGNTIAARLQIVGPELEDLLGDAGQGVFPALFHLVDGASLVGAERVGKAIDHHFGQPVAYRALDDGRGE